MHKFFRTLKKVLFAIILILIVCISSGYIYLYKMPKGPEVTDPKAIENGSDSFVMYSYEHSSRKSIKVWTYKPENWKNRDRILFVMHGGGRNADDYLDAWKEIAEINNVLIIAPEFENKFSKYITNDYQEGNLYTFFGSKNPEEEWAYQVIENIFDHLKKTNNITNKNYDIFGHSAGGQFVHRMILLMPEARIENAIAANAGFYTLPTEDLEYPYGLKDTPVTDTSLKKSFNKKMIILLGENDNDPELGTFRETELAMQQGRHRLERGSNFFKAASRSAKRKSWDLHWKIDTIQDVGHNYREMSSAAVKYLDI
ncbi:steryl acetyl hydrolase [Christiangramia sabulilitoris]|uniref:Steryl acetyl hydrolase n=1 Tax=Christiangramia sabulilitoris TaxID=2583991 RepID=A0A550I778_9FLAO|nr:steryl acetyl hydrolase [Christiangramia sabulilitoris]TRO66829.1 steryl acetyl hydrolase [Christiangramia sabulilitoris]